MLIELFRQISQCFSWLIVVAPWEQAIRVRMGKRVSKLEAGVYLRIPFADRIYKQSVRRRLALIRSQTLTTADRHVITVACAVGFSVSDLAKLYDTLESPNDTIDNEVAGIIARFVGSTKLPDCTSPALEAFVRENLCLDRYGLSGQEFYTTNFATCKTYRLISGEIATWSRDGQISMQEHVNTNGPS